MTKVQDLPKVELHLHLDCSPSAELLGRLDPSITPEVYQHDIQLKHKVTDLADFLRRIPRLLALMQSESQLREFTHDLFKQLKAEKVIYAEIRFAPLQHIAGGLSDEQVVTIVEAATREAIAETGVEARLILCCLRHFNREQSMRTAELAKAFQGSLVAGLDLAADEAGFTIDAHRDAFAFAREHGIKRTAHAGEACGADSVTETLDVLKPSRIGHGVRAIDDPALVRRLVHEGIHLEVCPSCNVIIDVFPILECHPIDELFKAGVSLSINTDGRTVPAVTLGEEYQKLQDVFGWTPDMIQRCNRNAIKASFADEATKKRLLAKLETTHN